MDAIITEQSCLTDFNDKQKLNELEKALETSVSKDIQSTITTSKNMKVDFPGLSRILHKQHKEQWHQISSNWDKL